MTLSTAWPETSQDQDLSPAAIRLIWDVDGVVDVVTRLSARRSQPSPVTGTSLGPRFDAALFVYAAPALLLLSRT